MQIVSKENRFNFFVVGYAAIFALLAFLGAVEASRMHDEEIHVQKVMSDKIVSVTRDQALYSLPNLDVTTGGGIGSHHLRLGISLQMSKDSVERFSDFQPIVSDRIVAFLDRQDITDFEGASGMSRMRHDILYQANQASGPVVISDIIFREFVVR